MTAQTSLDAHASIDTAALRFIVMRAIRESGDVGITCDEIEIMLDMRHQTASARIRELSLQHRVRVIGKRATRSGRMAQVYVAVTQ
jgi:predicted transcriptional regulator